MSPLVKLGELVSPSAPICYGILMPGPGLERGVPVIKVRHMSACGIDERDIALTSHDIDRQYARSRVQAGDLLMSIRGSTGIVVRVPPSLANANITQDSARIRVADPSLRDLVYFALCSPFVQRQVALHTIGQAVKGINIAQVRELNVPIPASSTDRVRLVRALHAFERAATTVETLLTAKRRLKRALMQRLAIDSKRIVRRLDDVAAINLEALPESTPDDLRFIYVELANVTEGKVELPASEIAFVDAPSRARRVVKPGDILLSTVRPLLLGFARVPTTARRVIASTGFAVLRAHDAEDQSFVYHSLFDAEVLGQIEARLAGSSFPAIGADAVASLRVPWPSGARRVALGRCMDRIDEACEKLDALLAALRLHRRGVMQRLLSGEIDMPQGLKAVHPGANT